MPPPRKKRSASCDGEECEDDEDGKKRAAGIKLRRGENAEEGQTRIVLPLAKIYTLTLMRL